MDYENIDAPLPAAWRRALKIAGIVIATPAVIVGALVAYAYAWNAYRWGHDDLTVAARIVAQAERCHSPAVPIIRAMVDRAIEIQVSTKDGVPIDSNDLVMQTVQTEKYLWWVDYQRALKVDPPGPCLTDAEFTREVGVLLLDAQQRLLR